MVETLSRGYSTLAPDTQRAFDNFSWQSFVALNWPADRAGAPLQESIATHPDAPRVWEFFPSQFAFFNKVFAGDNTAPPNVWNDADKKRPRRLYTQFTSRSALKSLQPSSFLEASSAKPLIDRKLNFVVYDIAFNRVEADYIQKYRLDTLAGQKAFHDQGYQVDFTRGFYQDSNQKTGGSVGSIEIKTAWRILDDEPQSEQQRYYTEHAEIYIDGDHSQTGKPLKITATLGLVGFHIMQHTDGPRGFPQDWIWSTFEHVDNAPLAENARDPTDLNAPLPNQATAPTTVSQSYSFFSPNYTGNTNEPPPLGTDVNYKWAATRPYATKYAFQSTFGTQSVRAWKILPATQEVNDYFQTKLAGTPWRNYQLIGTQWMAQPDPHTPVSNGNVPRYLSNTTMETYVQFSRLGSCLTCHKDAATAEPGLTGNFSFMLRHAK